MGNPTKLVIMTVKELKEKLNDYPDDKTVVLITEGEHYSEFVLIEAKLEEIEEDDNYIILFGDNK